MVQTFHAPVLLALFISFVSHAQTYSSDSLASFHQALRAWDGPAIERHVKGGIDVNGVSGGYSAMGMLAWNTTSLRDTQMLNYIGYRGGDINKDGGAGTPLYLLASKQGLDAGVQVAVMDWMVRHGARIQPVDGSASSSSPLTGALTYGNAEAALYLIRHGARVERWHLALAAEHISRSRAMVQKTTGWKERMALLDTLVGMPFNIAAQSRNYTALGHAIMHGDTSLMRMLLIQKPLLNLPTEGRDRVFYPIHLAAWKYPLDDYTPERLAILKMIIAAGADKGATTPQPYTSAVTHTKNPSIPAGANALDVALRSGAKIAAEYLNELGVKANFPEE